MSQEDDESPLRVTCVTSLVTIAVRPELALRYPLGFEDSSQGKEGVLLGVWLELVLLRWFCFVVARP
jgi:hypothetical protein